MLFLSNLAIVGTVLGLVAAAPGPVARRGSPCKPDYNVVPWDPKYNTGILPPGIESALGSQLGPNFLNPFYQNLTENEVGLGSCFQCTFTIVKEVPCIVKAIATENPAALLGCGLGKSDICACLSCLPEFAYKYVAAWCSSSAGEGIAATNEFSDNNFIAEADNDIKAFLGLLKVAEYQALKDAAAANPAPVLTSPNPTGLLGCTVGGQCGSCCCIGLCIFGSCGGLCV